jgi:hypothetical protein
MDAGFGLWPFTLWVGASLLLAMARGILLGPRFA